MDYNRNTARDNIILWCFIYHLASISSVFTEAIWGVINNRLKN